MSWWVRHWVPESNEDQWSMVTTTILLRWVHTYLLFWWHALWQLRKALNKQSWQHKQKCHTISPDINKQTNNNIMQHHAKQGYIFGHLSLIQSLAFNIPSGVTTMRDLKSCLSKREIFWVLFRAPLFFGKWCGDTTFFFFFFYIYTKKNEKK